jgi:Uma2 family endonuclease
MATDTRAATFEYPTSDGKPMAETDWHYQLLVDVRERLTARYADRPDVYVSGNLMVYYEPGNRRRFLSPDGFVVFGVPNRDRPYYLTWEEGRFPDVVFEFTSSSTRKEDRGKKFRAYQDIWKVTEYFLFDPLDEYLKPRLQGYRMADGVLVRLEPADGVLTSAALGLTLAGAGRRLLLRDAATGAELLTASEQRAAAESQRAAAESQRAAAESQRAAAEAARADAAEAEVARLRAELAALRGRTP